MATGSCCEETYHLSDVEGRKYAACERRGGGIEQKKKNHITKSSFSEKNRKVSRQFQNTQYSVSLPSVIQSYLGEGE